MAFPTSPTNGQVTVVNNISYQYSNATTSWTRILSTANIITANALASNGNISAAGNIITGNYFIGNGSLLTGIATGSSSNINNGTSNVTVVSSGGNITVGVGGTGNVAVFATTGEYITGVLSATANVTGGNLLTGGVVSATGNIAGNYFIGNGSLLTGIAGGSSTSISNGTSNVTVVSSGGNVTVSVGGTSNVAVWATTGEYIKGVLSASGNIIGGTDLYVGNGAAATAFTNPIAVFKDTGLTYVQVAAINSSGNGSADFTTYANNGDDTQSWADIGFTGNTFNDGNFTVTAPGDGYFFTQGNASFGGNMVIATGNTGTTKDIIFATGGFLTGNIKARLYNATGLLSVTGNIQGGNLVTGGLISSTGNAIHANVIINGTAAAGSGVLIVSGNIQTSTANATANIGNASNYFNRLFAQATTALYADLAEIYRADAQYPPGTVLVFGGTKEVTLSTVSHDNRIAGIVSTHPAHVMNSGLESEFTVEVGLVGRVPCRVVGPITAGDCVVSSNLAGVAERLNMAQYQPGVVIGKALESYSGSEVGTIEVVVGRL